MSVSKLSKERKENRSEFRKNAKKEAAQKSIPKQNLIPQTNWESTDILDLRGDLLEALEEHHLLTFQALRECQEKLIDAGNAFQRSAQVMQMIMQQNIKSGKIKLTYEWNNGEKPTDEEVASYEAKVKELRAEQLKRAEDAQARINAEKTGLVGPDGEPVGSGQSLEDENEEDEASGKANEAAGLIDNEEA